MHFNMASKADIGRKITFLQLLAAGRAVLQLLAAGRAVLTHASSRIMEICHNL